MSKDKKIYLQCEECSGVWTADALDYPLSPGEADVLKSPVCEDLLTPVEGTEDGEVYHCSFCEHEDNPAFAKRITEEEYKYLSVKPRQIIENPIEIHTWIQIEIEKIVDKNELDFDTDSEVFHTILRELSFSLVLTFEITPPVGWRRHKGDEYFEHFRSIEKAGEKEKQE